MIRRIHLNNRFLRLPDAKNDELSELRTPGKRDNGYPCFLRVQKTENTDDGMKLLTFSQEDISYLEMVNTMAYLESKQDCKNILFMSAIVGRPRWQVFETDAHVVLKISPSDLNVIQYGWGCTIACYKRTHRYLKAPVYPWVARAWMDTNMSIFKHGIACLVSTICHNKCIAMHLGNEEIDIIRKMPQLLAKFGKKNGQYVWESALLDKYLHPDNPFLLSLTSLLIPPHNNDFMYITEEGVQMFKDPWAPEVLRDFYNSRSRHACKDGKTYKLTLRGCPSLYPTLYNYMLSSELSAARSFALFMSVQKKRQVRAAVLGKRDRHGSQLPVKPVDIDRIYADAYRNLLDRTFTTETNICHLAKLLLYIEIRKEYGLPMYKNMPPQEFCKVYSVDMHWEYVQMILCKQTTFDPAVQLPKKSQHYKNLTASEAFPVLTLNAETRKRTMDICGASIYKYFQ